MEKLFDFYTRFDKEDDNIIDMKTNEIVCIDKKITFLNLSEKISLKLMSKGIDKLSRLILISNAFLQFCDFSVEEINFLYDQLNQFFLLEISKKKNHDNTFVLEEKTIDGEDIINEEYIEFENLDKNAGFDEDDYFSDSQDKELKHKIILQNQDNKEFLKIPIESLNLSVRPYHCLKDAGINNLSDLFQMDPLEIRSIRNLGNKSYREIINIIEKYKNSDYNKINSNDFDESKNSLFVENSILENHLKRLDSETLLKLPLESLNLSVRSYHCLKDAGIVSIQDLIGMDYLEIRNIRNLGIQSYKEIISTIEKILNSEKTNLKNENYELSNEAIIQNFFIPKFIKIESDKIYLLNYNVFIYDIDIFKIINNNPVMRKLQEYSINKLSDVLKSHNKLLQLKSFGQAKYDLLLSKIKIYINENLITEANLHNAIANEISNYVLKYEFNGVSRVETIEYFSNKFSKDDVICTIEELIENRVLFIYEDDKLFYRYESFPYFLYHLKKDLTPRLTDIMFSKIDGLTLSEIAQKYNVTKELVRQQISKFMKKYVYLNGVTIKTFKEDKYAYFFEKYSFSKKEFIDIFLEKERTYNYLNMRYKNGETQLSEAINDSTLPKRFRAIIQSFFEKDLIIINGSRLPKKKIALLEYYISEKVLKQMRTSEIILKYNEFIKKYDETMQIIGNEHSTEGVLSRINNVVASLNKQYRFYDFSAYDWDTFLDEINLEGYDGLNIYSNLIYDKHMKLMKKYNILDCYELHNILKKLYDGKNEKIVFGRMPNITIGEFNRKEYMLNILEEHGELSSNEFIKILDEQLGIGVQAANWIIDLNDYRDYGKYVYELQIGETDTELIEVLKENLNEEFYFKIEIEKIIKNNNLDINKFKNLARIYRKLGYQVYSSYILKNQYNSTTSFFEKLLTENDIFELSIFKKYQGINIFTDVFIKLKSNYDIIQFSKESYINFRKLQAFGISKEDLFDYCEAVASTMQNDYFTITSLEKVGFNSELYNLGFENVFYESILKFNPKIMTLKINNTYVFKITDESISKTTFISEIIEQYRVIETDNLINLLENTYGIIVDLQDLKLIIENTSIYYNSIMDTFYTNYDIFIKEI